jgi:hypothetical protein
MVINSTNINKQAPLFSTKLIEHKKKNTTYAVGIPGPGWDRHKHVAGLNRLMGSKPSPLDNWISNSNAYIKKR